MNEASTRLAWERGQLPAIGLAMLLIVVLPFLLLQELSENNPEAADAVAHTHQVEAAVDRLAMEVREVETAAMLITLSGELPNARSRFSKGCAAIPAQYLLGRHPRNPCKD